MIQKQKAILTGANFDNRQNFKEQMEELLRLADACDINVVGEITQNLNHENTAHYIGKGKIQEVLELLNETNADMVIFNDELTSSQIRNLEAALKCRIVDRTVLILDIFAQRAKTKEAKLQVKIAELQYMLPRLVGLRDSLDRQGGSGGAGFINRGSGETKLELDRRKIADSITNLHKELETLVAQRQNQRKRRKKQEIPVVALVGYTNSGKSTIMNVMMELYGSSADKQVLEKDMLFATLETSVRSIKFPDNKSLLLTDTVGFINKLPHHLVKAFRSTLEEVTEADVLIHVVDYSNPNYKQQIEVTMKTLSEIGVDEDIPVIYAYNKIDLAEGEISEAEEDSIYISAKNKTGIENLVNAIRQKAFTQYVHCEMLIPYDKGNVVSYLNDNAHITSTIHESNGILMSLECKKSDCEKYREYVNEADLE